MQALRVMRSSVGQGVRAISSEFARASRRRASGPVIEKFLAGQAHRRVHIGAGGNLLAGWLNTDLEPQSPDIAYLDVTERLPFPDNSIDLIFSEHLFEHLPHAVGVDHLRECYRVLRPGGRIRIATPDLQFLIDIYTQQSHSDVQSRYVKRTLDQGFPKYGFYHGGFVLNHFVKHWGHQFIFDEATLGHALRTAGFPTVKRWAVGQSDEPHLTNIERHGDAITPDFNLLQTIVMEGTKS